MQCALGCMNSTAQEEEVLWNAHIRISDVIMEEKKENYLP